MSEDKLKYAALDSVGEYIASKGWEFGGDQADFMWLDPLSKNWYFADNAFVIQLDRDMIAMIAAQPTEPSGGPKT